MALTGAIPFYSPKMKLLQAKLIKIGNKDYPAKLGVRVMLNFEQLSGHSPDTISTLNDVTMLFYCAVKAGGYELTYEQFIDEIDEHPEAIKAFTDAMVEPSEKKH